MDADRKSTVSSFYGARKESFDPATVEPLGYSRRPDNDGASSFYNPRTSQDLLQQSAGYNQDSFVQSGRVEPMRDGKDDDPWDVYADFNNAGPRYSSAFGQQNSGYRPIETPTQNDRTSINGPTEMVTVPALGAEWGRGELRDMTKAGKRERKADSRRDRYRQWRQGSGKWFTKRVIVWVVFVTCVVVGVIIAVTLPRVPGFTFNSEGPIIEGRDENFNRAPANFSFLAVADFKANTHSNLLPITLNKLTAEIFDVETNRKVGTGELRNQKLKAKSYPNVMLPLNFTYVASNDTDTTWVNMYEACRNRGASAGGVRPGLDLRFVLTMWIRGLVGKHYTSEQIIGVECPVELALNAG